MSHKKYQSCIDACNACLIECEHCATACLSEKDIDKLTRCIQLDRDCADICRLAIQLMSRGSKFADQICGLCADICEACANECANHKEMEHCKRCEDACNRCAEECRKMTKS